MKIGHISDLHYANDTLIEVDRCVGFAVEEMLAANVDAVVLSGDATDHRLDLHSPAVRALANRIRQLSDSCPVLMLQGTFSHEPPGALNILELTAGRHPVFVADRLCQVALTPAGWVVSPSWRFDAIPDGTRCLFTCIPTINKAALAAASDAMPAAEKVAQGLTALLAGYADINIAARMADIQTVGVGHGTVSGCMTEHGIPMAGLDNEFTTGSLFSAQTSAFLLGHIHKHQAWHDNGRTIAYAGSVGRLHYGEIDPKGFLVWDVTPAAASFCFIGTPARRMILIDFPGIPDMEELRRVATNTSGAFVRVRWTIDEEHKDAVDRNAIANLFKDAAATKLEGRVVPIARSRAEGMNRALSLDAKLAKWCETTQTNSEGLYERLSALQAEEPEVLSARLVG